MTAQTSSNGCVIKYPGSVKGPVRHQLVIFPHAGGSASFYQPWRQKIPSDCDLLIVQYPARGSAEGKPAWKNAEQAITACSNGLRSLLGIAPITIFGHSMGALLAVHVAATLNDTRFTLFQRIVSAQKIPQELAELNQESIRNALLETILQHSEQSGVMAMDERTRYQVSAFILQDLELLGQLALLPVNDDPLRIFGSANDPLLSVGQLKRWQGVVSNCQLTVWPGDHFYFTQRLEAFLGEIIPAHPE